MLTFRGSANVYFCILRDREKISVLKKACHLHAAEALPLEAVPAVDWKAGLLAQMRVQAVVPVAHPRMVFYW